MRTKYTNTAVLDSYLAVWSNGYESPFICSADDDLWIALAEQFPRDDPTIHIEYVLDKHGKQVDY
jgi:hypothetical protein